MPNSPWDGGERRRCTDHDTLIELVQITKSLAESLHAHRDAFKEHQKEDSQQFRVLNRAYWMGMGAVVVIDILLKWK